MPSLRGTNQRPLLTAVVSLERTVADGFEGLSDDPAAMKILIDVLAREHSGTTVTPL